MTKLNNKFSWKDSISLKEYVDEGIENLEEKSKIRQDATDKALELATRQMEHRLEGMNEFRDQLNKQAATFVTRDILETKIQLINTSIKNLEEYKSITKGKASQSSLYVAYLFSGLGLLIGALSFLRGI